MPSHFKKYSIPTVLVTGLAALVLSACGGGSDDPGATELAKFAPADAPVFIEGSLQPSSEVAANVDSITEDLVGVNIGDLIKDRIDSSSEGDVNFDDDVKPWLGENAGIYVQFDPSDLANTVPGSELSALTTPETGSTGPATVSYSPDDQAFGLVVQTTDTDAAQSFIDKQAADQNAKDGEYEGFSYKIAADDGSTIGIVDDNLLVASSEAEFKAAVDASKGDNMADTDVFKDLSGNVADGALVTVFASNTPYIEAMKQQGFDLSDLYSALGIDIEDTGTVVSLVPEQNEISLKGYTNISSEMTSGDPSSVIETFPADTVFATGSGDVGSNATKIMDALNKEGIPGVLKPGQVDEFINEASGQVDVKGILSSLETVAFFVNGSNVRNVGGALVATSSDIEPIESSLRGISTLIGLAGDASVRPLPGNIAGFRVLTDELPGKPVVIGVKGDRMVIGIGMNASLTALSGKGATLADSDAYQAADASTPEDGLDMFADPKNLAKLVLSSGDPDAVDIAKVINKFQYMAAGSSDSEGTFEFNMGLRD